MTTTPEISVDDLATAMAGGDAVVIDVREPDEYAAGHVPGARSLPLRQLPALMGELERDTRVHVVCASGGRSRAATDVLRVAGCDAVSVAGGTQGWLRAGRSVVTGAHPTA